MAGAEDCGPSERDAVGVYVIFRSDRTVVRVGVGYIKKRVTAHRNSEQIKSYAKKDEPLLVTWALAGHLTRDQLKAIERYLDDQLGPKVCRYPDVQPQAVNLPF